MFPLILIYLGAITLANLVIGTFGAVAVIPVGFALIGLDLVARDRLHNRLHRHGRGVLVGGMAALIVAGGVISYAISLATGVGPLVGRVALASCIAFVAAAAIDAVAYHVGHELPPVTRSTASNIPAALVDSWLFLSLAFPGPTPYELMALQFAAKATGGLLWAWLLFRRQPVAVG